jgi:hypothetical protein
MSRRRSAPPLTLTREPTAQDDTDLATYADAKRMIRRIKQRLETAMEDNVTEMRWLHKRLVAVERAAQERALAAQNAAQSHEGGDA